MIGLSFAFASGILFIYITVKELKPTKDYYGNEEGLAERATEVIYYNSLNTLSTIVYPIIAGIAIILNFVKENIKNVFNNILVSILLGMLIAITTVIIAKLHTKIAVNRAVKKGDLKKYIGGMWYKVIK